MGDFFPWRFKSSPEHKQKDTFEKCLFVCICHNTKVTSILMYNGGALCVLLS